MVSRERGDPRSLFLYKLKKNLILISFTLLVFAFSCREEGELEPNLPPETTFSIESINVADSNRLNSIVRLSWYGSDKDGYIKGYEISQDAENWAKTTSQDSTFRFTFPEGSELVDITLYARAIDNNGAKDPSPAFIKIPIKNTSPTVGFSEDLVIPDTAFIVATTEWSAADLDGEETITDVYLSINGKEWYPLNKSEKVFSIVPADFNATDTTSAYIYYGSRTNPAAETIPGLVLNDTNVLYIKAVDQAGAESMLDTSNTFYLKSKQNDVLVVGGVEAAHNEYKSLLNSINLNYDFLNLTIGNGRYRPALWNTTFRLQLSFYDKLFFYSDETTFLNPYTNLKIRLIEFAAASLQEYANSGGKYLISTKFDWDDDIEAIVGVLPIQSVSSKNYGQAWLLKDDPVAKYKDTTYEIADTVGGQPMNRRDTTITIVDNDFPVLRTSEFSIQGVGVFNIDPNDTEVLYRAKLIDRATFTPWTSTNIVASARRRNGKLNQIFFTIPLYRLKGNQANLEALFNRIFNQEFN